MTEIICGDCLEVLPTIEAESIDLVVTDPPYGINFMSSAGFNDKALPDPAVWRECLRVLKPGGFAFIMCIPRLWHRLACGVEDAGFEVCSPIYHTFAQGFPKARRVTLNKAFCQCASSKHSEYGKAPSHCEDDHKDRGDALLCSANSLDDGIPGQDKVVSFLGDCQPHPDSDGGLSHLDSMASPASSPLQECAQGHTRLPEHGDVQASAPSRKTCSGRGGDHLSSSGCQFSVESEICIDASTSLDQDKGQRGIVSTRKDTAKQVDCISHKASASSCGQYNMAFPICQTCHKPNADGWIYGNSPLKPAVEVIGVFMKPYEGKAADSILKHGVGAVNARAGAIPHAEPIKAMKAQSEVSLHNPKCVQAGRYHDTTELKPMGRFPANLLVEDDVLDDGRERLSVGGSGLRSQYPTRGEHTIAWMTGESAGLGGYGDSGSFSRYFSLDSWADKLIANLPPEAQRTFPFLIVPKASPSERNKGLEAFPKVEPQQVNPTTKRCSLCGCTSIGGLHGWPICGHGPDYIERVPYQHGGDWKAVLKNNHPTLKPLRLMLYLIMLTTRPGYTILDPFMGSGTTLMACKVLGRNGIGIELEQKWCDIARARIDATAPVEVPLFMEMAV